MLHLTATGNENQVKNQGVCDRPSTMIAVTAGRGGAPKDITTKQNVDFCELGIHSYWGTVSPSI